MESKNKHKMIASIGLALVALAWGTSYAVVKDTVDILSPITLMTIRFGGAALFLSIVYFKRVINIRKEDIFRGVLIGVFLFAGFHSLAIGILYTTASKQSFIIGGYVLIVPFLSWLINKKHTDKFDVIGAILAIVGLAMLTLGGESGINKGDVISLFAAFCFSFHMIYIEKFCHKTDPIVLTVVQCWVATIIFLGINFIFDYGFNIPKDAVIPIIYLIVVATVIAFVGQNVAQKYISSTSTALILTLESAFGSIFAVFYLGEALSGIMIVGCAIIFVGIVIQSTKLEFLKK